MPSNTKAVVLLSDWHRWNMPIYILLFVTGIKVSINTSASAFINLMKEIQKARLAMQQFRAVCEQVKLQSQLVASKPVNNWKN